MDLDWLNTDLDENKLIFLPLRKLCSLIGSKKISSVELVSTFIKRIEKVNTQINAVVAARFEEALADARNCDNQFRRQAKRGPLYGIPCTIKDSFDVAGLVSTAGTSGRANYIPDKDATVVQRIKNAGAIILGKTNTSELTMEFFTDNPVYGKTKNPYNADHSPGGSSGGAAAIIAAGGSPFDIGSDTGGSIRFPSHCCGVKGLKPTAGRVPRSGHIISFYGVMQSLTHVGPIASHFDDLEVLLQLISGPDNIDPYVYPAGSKEPQNGGFGTLRCAFFTDNNLYEPNPEVKSAVMQVVNILNEYHLPVQEALPAAIRQTPDLSDNIFNTGDWLKRVLDKNHSVEHSLHWITDNIHEISSSEYNKIIERVDAFRSEMLSFWNNYDLLICPVSPSTAPKLDTPFEGENYYSYTTAFNITGWPAVSIPVGIASNGLPIGTQIVAPPWRESTLLTVAKFLEERLTPITRPAL